MKINFLFAPSIVIALSFGLTSCTWGPQKIPMTTSGSTSTPPPSAYNPVDTASIASSNQASAGVSIPEEAELRLRFKTLSAGYTSESDLVKSEQYKKFVTDIYTLFATYKAKPGNHEKELKYIFDQMIPYMVMDEWVKNNKSNEKKAELIVQSVKRKDFNALRDKELLTEKYKIYFEEQRFNPFVKTLTDERITLIKSSDTEFAKQFFDIQNGVVVSILSPRYDWNKTGIGYKPGELEAEFTTYLNAKFEKALLLLEVTPEVLEKKTFSYYAVDSLE